MEFVQNQKNSLHTTEWVSFVSLSDCEWELKKIRFLYIFILLPIKIVFEVINAHYYFKHSDTSKKSFDIRKFYFILKRSKIKFGIEGVPFVADNLCLFDVQIAVDNLTIYSIILYDYLDD